MVLVVSSIRRCVSTKTFFRQIDALCGFSSLFAASALTLSAAALVVAVVLVMGLTNITHIRKLEESSLLKDVFFGLINYTNVASRFCHKLLTDKKNTF